MKFVRKKKSKLSRRKRCRRRRGLHAHHCMGNGYPLAVRRLRDDLMKWILDMEPKLMVTFNFGHEIDPITAQARIKHFFNRVQRKVLGKRWNKRPADDRIAAIGCFEHPDTNPHFHVLVAAPDHLCVELRANARQLWLLSVPRGQIDVQIAKSKRSVVSYSTKRLETIRAFDDLFVYSAGSL